MENENRVEKNNGNEIKSLLALKSIFSFNGKKRNGDSEGGNDAPAYNPLPFLSSLANSVVSRSCK